jgi:pimeloyl-ACP methyl ester carboxylesterase
MADTSGGDEEWFRAEQRSIARDVSAYLVRMVTRRMIAVVAAAASCTPAPKRVDDQTPGGIRWARCTLQNVPGPFRCGTLTVAENPTEPNGRQLQIGFAILQAGKPSGPAEPIVPLMGGPGESAIGAAAVFAERLATLRRDHDILLVDQRGTGQSGALDCELFSIATPNESLRDLFPVPAVTACERRLSARADLTQYSHLRFAGDLEGIRRALGYGPMHLIAGSYGTRAAQVIVRSFPASVRTVYFGSAVPLDVVAPLTFAKTADESLERTIASCEAERDCHRAFPDLRTEMREVRARLEAGQVHARAPGESDSVVLASGRVAEWLRALNYRPTSAALVPWIIHHAHLGDWSPIVDGILAQANGLGSALSLGLLFSITCNEDLAFLRQSDVDPATHATFLGDYRLRQQERACGVWPKAPVPADYREPVRSSIPALFVSGDQDGASPLWFTERVAAGFSVRAEIVLPGRGHTEWTECVSEAYAALVRTGSVDRIENSCAPSRRPRFRVQ